MAASKAQVNKAEVVKMAAVKVAVAKMATAKAVVPAAVPAAAMIRRATTRSPRPMRTPSRFHRARSLPNWRGYATPWQDWMRESPTSTRSCVA